MPCKFQISAMLQSDETAYVYIQYTSFWVFAQSILRAHED